jgi:hypothetical protein
LRYRQRESPMSPKDLPRNCVRTRKRSVGRDPFRGGRMTRRGALGGGGDLRAGARAGGRCIARSVGAAGGAGRPAGDAGGAPGGARAAAEGVLEQLVVAAEPRPCRGRNSVASPAWGAQAQGMSIAGGCRDHRADVGPALPQARSGDRPRPRPTRLARSQFVVTQGEGSRGAVAGVPSFAADAAPLAP